MCYAIPGRVAKICGNRVVVDYFGESRIALSDSHELHTGDYVYAQGGVVVDVAEKNEARAVLRRWKSRFFELKQLDRELAGNNYVGNEKTALSEFSAILWKARRGIALNRKELIRILETTDSQKLRALFNVANLLRLENIGNACCVHGIIEFSNVCRNDCAYCGIRAGNKRVKRYRMGIDEISEVAEHAVNELGFKALVLQSGEDEWYDAGKLCSIIKSIKDRCGALLFVSVGSRSKQCYKNMYGAGARGALIKFETSNRQLYEKMHMGVQKGNPGRRIELIKYAKKLGFIVATGSIISLPCQSSQDIVNDILLAESLGADMHTFGPLVPADGMKFAVPSKPPLAKILKSLALCRIINPRAKIPATTALETLYGREGIKSAFLAGANSMMINVTPEKYRKRYSIYLNKADAEEPIEKRINGALELLYGLGRAPTDFGI